MIRSAQQFGLTAAETVKISQELDQLLNLKQKELLKQTADHTHESHFCPASEGSIVVQY